MTRSNAAAIAALEHTEILDGDMTPSNLKDALERLRFRHGLLTIRLDREVRDYFVRLMK